MSTILLTLLIISILIIIHEGGHFLLARLSGVKVLEFSVGFGPRIFKKKIGDTIYSLSAIPFGGYVRMSGEEPGKEFYEEYDFLAQPYHKKVGIVLGGPVFNFLFAIVVFIIAYSVVGYPVVPISHVERVEEGSPAQKAGFVPGDSIVSVDGKEIKTWEEFYELYSKKDTNSVEVIREGKLITLTLTGKSPDSLGIVPYIPPVIYKVDKFGAAWKAGLKSGDRIIAINGEPIRLWEELVKVVRAHPQDTLIFTVLRGKDTLTFRVIPDAVPSPDGKQIGRIGVLLRMVNRRLPPLLSIKVSIEKSYEFTVRLLAYLGRLVRGKGSIKQVGGPVMIGRMVETSKDYGLFNLLFLIGLISVNLFVVNLIPFPALDGWHILLFSVEAIIRRPLSEDVKNWLQLIGFAFLILLMILITFFDILRLVK